MQCKAHDAYSISVSSGREGPRPPEIPAGPLIVLNYPYDLAQELALDVLRPFAKPELCFAGYYRHRDGKMTLGCYLVVRAIDGPTYMIGNERDFPDAEWRTFHERLNEFGTFNVSCGIETGDSNRAVLTKPPWFMTVRTFHREDIVPLVTKEMFR